jgi:hypothetical protein
VNPKDVVEHAHLTISFSFPKNVGLFPKVLQLTFDSVEEDEFLYRHALWKAIGVPTLIWGQFRHKNGVLGRFGVTFALCGKE